LVPSPRFSVVPPWPFPLFVPVLSFKKAEGFSEKYNFRRGGELRKMIMKESTKGDF